jgi:hypothetical protein
MTVPVAINPNDPEIRKQAAAALEALKSTDPENAGKLEIYLAALHNNKVVALATDEVFALRDKTGEIRAFKQRVHLSAKDGTLVQPGFKLPYIISATGYVRLAEAGGVIVMNAPTVIVDGREEQNPYVSRDPSNGRVLGVYCRSIAFRYSPKGIPQVSDRTAFFDVLAYRMIDLLAKAKGKPQAFKLLPSDAGKPEGGGTWACYRFDEATNLYLDTSHDEALQFLAQHINREKKALEFAQTFSQRNAVKHLLGLQMPPGQTRKFLNQRGYEESEVTPISEWDVDLTCWRPTDGNVIKWDQTRYVKTVQNLAAVSGGSGEIQQITQGPTNTVVSMGMDNVLEDEEALASLLESDPEDPAQRTIEAEFTTPEDRKANPETGEVQDQDAGPEQEPEPAPAEDQAPEQSAAQRNLAVAFSEFPDEIKRAKARAKINHAAPYTDEEAEAILTALHSILNAGS